MRTMQRHRSHDEDPKVLCEDCEEVVRVANDNRHAQTHLVFNRNLA